VSALVSRHPADDNRGLTRLFGLLLFRSFSVDSPTAPFIFRGLKKSLWRDAVLFQRNVMGIGLAQHCRVDKPVLPILAAVKRFTVWSTKVSHLQSITKSYGIENSPMSLDIFIKFECQRAHKHY